MFTAPAPETLPPLRLNVPPVRSSVAPVPTESVPVFVFVPPVLRVSEPVCTSTVPLLVAATPVPTVVVPVPIDLRKVPWFRKVALPPVKLPRLSLPVAVKVEPAATVKVEPLVTLIVSPDHVLALLPPRVSDSPLRILVPLVEKPVPPLAKTVAVPSNVPPVQANGPVIVRFTAPPRAPALSVVVR